MVALGSGLLVVGTSAQTLCHKWILLLQVRQLVVVYSSRAVNCLTSDACLDLPCSINLASTMRTAHKCYGLMLHCVNAHGYYLYMLVGSCVCVCQKITSSYTTHISLPLKGLAADKAGLKEGDQIVSVNRQDVTSLKHEDLVGMIKKVSEI